MRKVLVGLAVAGMLLGVGVAQVPATEVVEGAAPAGPPRCPELADVPGLGLACSEGPGGLLRVHAPDGRFLGTTHGLDPVMGDLPGPPGLPEPPEGPGAAQPSVPAPEEVHPLLQPAGRGPVCVEAALGPVEPHSVVIYARAHDDADNYAAKVNGIRNLVRTSDAWVRAAAVATGGPASIKVLCSAGEIVVRNEVLPTDRADASFSSVMNDLVSKGYASPQIKFWVYYDDRSACGCAGAAILYGHDAPGPVNLNNGFAPLPQYAITFDYMSAYVMLHELAHTMGAVQGSAPHSTGAGHCTDGRDVMCYRDGGPNAGQYSGTVCSGLPFDCNHDDYFHRDPPEGSYLADHWNLGSGWNRFLHFGPALDARLPAPEA